MSSSLTSWNRGSSLTPTIWSTRRSMAMGLHAMFLAAILLVSGVAGQDPSKRPVFLYPPNGSKHVYNKMDTVVVSYRSFHETVDLWTFCEPGRGRMIYRQAAPGFTASAAVLLNFTSDTGCWFNIRTGEEGIDAENSATFDLLGEERKTGPMVFGLDTEPPATLSTSSAMSSSAFSSLSSSSTSASSSPPSSSTTSSSSAAATTDGSSPGSSSGGGGGAPNPNPAPTDNRTSSSTSSSSGEGGAGGSSGLSAGASAGIGIGAAIGTIALAGGIFMLLRRRQSRQHSVAAAAAAAEMEGNNEVRYIGHGGSAMRTQQYFPDALAAHKRQYNAVLNAVSSPVEILNSAPFGGSRGRGQVEMPG